MNDDVEIFPKIPPHDYGHFRNLMGDELPTTYNEWLNLQQKEMRDFNQAGRPTREVVIESNHFSNFLRARDARPNLVSLRNFTIETDAGSRF